MAKNHQTDLTEEEAVKLLNELFAKFVDDVDIIRRHAIEDINSAIKDADKRELSGLRGSFNSQ